MPQISFPIVYFLIPYGIFAIFYLIYSFFNVYHLLRFGVYGYMAYITIAVYAGVSIFIIGTSVFFLAGYDWTIDFNLGSIFGSQPTDVYEFL